MRNYRVVGMTDEEFDRLPFRGIEGKVGVADPATNTAYYRESGIPVIDLFTVAHELQHLDERDEGTIAHHYDPQSKVYYKGFGEVFQHAIPAVLAMIPGVGPLAAGGAEIAIANKQAGKASKQGYQSQFDTPSGGGDSGGGFQPSAPAFATPQARLASGGFNTPGGGGTPSGPAGQAGPMGSSGGSVIDRLKGFFSLRGTQV